MYWVVRSLLPALPAPWVEIKAHSSLGFAFNSVQGEIPSGPSILLFLSIVLLLVSAVLLFFYLQSRRNFNQQKKENSELWRENAHLESMLAARSVELREAADKARESERLKSLFVSNMSHEVRTPLNGIMGFSRLLYDDSLSPKVRKKYLDIIERRSQSLLRLLNDILSVSLLESGKLELKLHSCNVNLLLNDLCTYFTSEGYENFKPLLKIKVIQSLPESQAVTVTDCNRLEQILINLIDNAVKFTPHGNVEFGYKLQGDTLLFFVSDTGVGISSNNLSRIFDRFSKISAPPEIEMQTSGTGLGLFIAKTLVELLHGNIWVESQPGTGSTFYFTIPYVPQKLASMKHISRSMVLTSTLNLSEKLILVVEDDLISFQLIENLLSPTGARIIHAKNGEDALELVAITPSIDLVLMDMQLPFLSGYEITPIIKKERPGLPIVAQTAHAMEGDREKCLKAGCDDYIPKPIDPDEFIIVVGKFLLSETPVSD